MARQLSKKDKTKIDLMNKANLGQYILKVNTNSGAFRYAIKKFVNKKKVKR